MINIIDRSNGGKTTRCAYPINDYLCIVPLEDGYMIFKTISGKPFINITWKPKEVAIQVGNALNTVYGEYLPLWEVSGWENADVVTLCQWSVKNGVNIATILNSLKGQIITRTPEILSGVKDV